MSVGMNEWWQNTSRADTRQAPSKAQRGGNHAWSIQQMAAQARPMPTQTPTIGCPVTTCASASSSPEAGGYFDAYVGHWMTWNVSKWTPIGWGGLVSRPCANVSAISR